MPPRTALLAGATGLVGSHLLSILKASPHYARVIVLTRKLIQTSDDRVEQRVVDFDNLTPFGPVDDVFCSLGTTIKRAGSQAAFRKVDYDYPLAVARQAIAEGAKQYLLVSSVGANLKSPNFYLRVKGELEDALGAMPFRCLHIYHPSFILGQRPEARSGENLAIVAAKLLKPVLAGPLRKYRAIPAEAVARAMVECAVRSEAGRHEYAYDAMRPFIRQQPNRVSSSVR